MTSPGNGCRPLNIFGAGASSPEAIDYVLDTQWQSLRYRQQVVEADIQGEPFSTWAGPVSLAVGASYRWEDVSQVSDAQSTASAFVLGNPQPFGGEYTVKEVFGEAVVPLLNDAPIARSLDVELAARRTHYSTSGSVTTWKLGLSYVPIADLRVRATRSRDIRAPSLSELFTGQVTATATGIDPFTNPPSSVRAIRLTGGNPALKPEKADTWAAGVVYSPRWLPGFTTSVDYYKISIFDAITSVQPQEVIDRCYSGNQTLCGLITRSGGVITELRTPLVNLAELDTYGVDIEASYRAPLSTLFANAPGSFGIRGLASYVGSYKTSDGITALEFAGSVLSSGSQKQPHWIGQLSWFYTLNKLTVNMSHRFVGGAVYSNQYDRPFSINNNKVAARAYMNLNVTYKLDGFGQEAEVFFNADNITNVDPPPGFAQNQAAPLYDLVGPMFKTGLRIKY